jgi:cytidyltransferase-like protein
METNPMNVVYSFLVLDLPHGGHIQHLHKALELGDVLIVGILDDKTVAKYKRKPIMSLEERMMIAMNLKGVDLVIPQYHKFPLDNLKLLHNLFPNDKLICCHADDWKKSDFQEIITYLNLISGKLQLVPYDYSASSTSSLIKKIVKLHGE